MWKRKDTVFQCRLKQNLLIGKFHPLDWQRWCFTFDLDVTLGTQGSEGQATAWSCPWHEPRLCMTSRGLGRRSKFCLLLLPYHLPPPSTSSFSSCWKRDFLSRYIFSATSSTAASLGRMMGLSYSNQWFRELFKALCVTIERRGRVGWWEWYPAPHLVSSETSIMWFHGACGLRMREKKEPFLILD